MSNYMIQVSTSENIEELKASLRGIGCQVKGIYIEPKKQAPNAEGFKRSHEEQLELIECWNEHKPEWFAKAGCVHGSVSPALQFALNKHFKGMLHQDKLQLIKAGLAGSFLNEEVQKKKSRTTFILALKYGLLDQWAEEANALHARVWEMKEIELWVRSSYSEMDERFIQAQIEEQVKKRLGVSRLVLEGVAHAVS